MVSQDNLHGANQGDQPLGVKDVLGEVPIAAEESETTEHENSEPNTDHEPQRNSAHEPANGETDSEQSGDSTESAERTVNGFDGLGLPSQVLEAVKKVGFEQPSPIQKDTIPVLMAGHDVVGLAQTGTGKTAAFALPILSQIDVKSRHPQALVLAPTRELALQVAESFQSFADNLGGIHVLPIYGGQAYGVQLSGLRRGAHIVVGTPGRVIDHLEKGSLDISCLLYTSPSPRD